VCVCVCILKHLLLEYARHYNLIWNVICSRELQHHLLKILINNFSNNLIHWMRQTFCFNSVQILFPALFGKYDKYFGFCLQTHIFLIPLILQISMLYKVYIYHRILIAYKRNFSSPIRNPTSLRSYLRFDYWNPKGFLLSCQWA